jgi:hypothetical protein
MPYCKSALILNRHLVPVRIMHNFSVIDRVGRGAWRCLSASLGCGWGGGASASSPIFNK